MYINGPINAIRLEGTINNINKIIYLFMDYHLSTTEQTDCASYESVNVDKYLYDVFKKTTKPIDFFLEIYESFAFSKYIPFNKGRYIDSAMKLFKKAKLDEETKKNINENVRFHFMDIREYLEKNLFFYVDNLESSMDTIRQHKTIGANSFNNILESCSGLIYELEFYQKFFELEINKKKIKENNLPTEPRKEIMYFLNKITQKYKNPGILNKIKKQYFTDVLKQIKLCIENLKELNKLISSTEDYVYRYYEKKRQYIKNNDNLDGFFGNYMPITSEFIFKCDKLNDNIQKKIIYIFLKITDLFFLRRFLDKDYITKAIVYTGGSHSANYINILTSFFDFKITHFSYSDEPDLDKLNKIAKEDVGKLQYTLFPQELVQCSDLSSFPTEDFN